MRKQESFDYYQDVDQEEILKGFTRVFDKIKMKNTVILGKFNKYISQMVTMKDKVDFMNWIINMNKSEEQEI